MDNTFYTPPKIGAPESARRSVALALSKYYAEELATAEPPDAPRFSVRSALLGASQPHGGLRDGHEREICGATALIAGEHYDAHRILIPLHVLQTRDLAAGVAGAGGYLVSTDVASPVDVLRPWSVVAEAGVTVLTGLQGNVSMPRVSSPSTAGWVSTEGIAYTTGQPALGEVAMTPKTAAVTVNFSREWMLQSGPAGELLLRQQLLGAVGALVDGALFAGTGASGQPTGLLNTAGIGTQAGTSLAHAGVLAMRKAVLAAGGREDRLRWVGTPAVQDTLGARERAAGGGRFLWDDGAILGRPAAATSTAPTGTLICGDFGAAYFGIWGPPAVRVEVNPLHNFQQGVLAARVVLSCDVAFPQPAAFSVATSVT